VILLCLLGLALLWTASRPDRSGWAGTVRRWRIVAAGLVLLGALYAILFVFVQLLVGADLALGLVPGWHSAIMPAHQAVSGFQGGLAATLLAAAGLRRWSGAREPIEPGAFHAAGKLLLALALLWFYFWWSEFLTYWYGRTPEERWLLGLLMFGPYLGPFVAAALLSFLLPTALLIWNSVRNSVAGPVLAAALTLAGGLADRLRVYVAAWSVASAHSEAAGGAEPPLPPTLLPGPLELLVTLGALAGALLLYLLAARLLPVASTWEVRSGERLRLERAYLATRVELLARPR
jgi:molybdopterin-containing oxidoreductase family membrane subunit